ncbi:hypothetical protein C8T65DRAFT_137919 [Cerioporus squamosus]|nr:hypothetical protein C8T65DRAFT_137919 [Cerioporus squamosus]
MPPCLSHRQWHPAAQLGSPWRASLHRVSSCRLCSQAAPTDGPASTSSPPPPRALHSAPVARRPARVPTRPPGGCTLTPASERPLPFPGGPHRPLAAELRSPLISRPDLAQSTQPKIPLLGPSRHHTSHQRSRPVAVPMSSAPPRPDVPSIVRARSAHIANISYTASPGRRHPIHSSQSPSSSVHIQAV